MTRQPAFEGAPDERQTLMASIAGFTSDGAFAAFTEDRQGVLKPGAFADLVILSGDIGETAPERMDELKVAATICDGRVTYERGVS